LICAGRILVKRRGRAAPERGIARASAVVQGRATIGTRMNRQLYSVSARRSAHSCETVALVDASSPLTYAATPLWAVADPIRCSVTHIQRAETVTDRTLPRCSPLSDVSVSVEQRGKGNKRNLVVWRLTAPLCARPPSLFLLSQQSIQVLPVGACRHFCTCGLCAVALDEKFLDQLTAY
jgi:hypothetical protein